jgi:tetratricopeptide (TPR) repeat protein
MNFNLSNVFQALQSTHASTVPAKPQRPITGINLGYFRGQAIVEQAIQPDRPGRVRFKGSRWFARCDQSVTIGPNEFVDIIGVQNITLLVEPAFLLSASKIGLTKIQQALEHKLSVLAEESLQNFSQAQIAALMTERLSPISEAIAPEIWQRFIQGKPVYLRTFQTCCDGLELNWKDIVGYGDLDGDLQLADVSEVQALQSPPAQDTNFVGRAEAIADLKRLVSEDAQMIVILGEGGIGKTVLAQQYFSQAGFDLVLECWMAREAQNITSAEGVVLNWLQTYLPGEAGRSFGATLEQLRQWLQNKSSWGSDKPQKIGVLIDNLEPALDRNGRFLEAHRSYVQLLQVLSDPALDCVVLITSREPLHEPTIALQSYVLLGLDEAAWRQFFVQRQIAIDSPLLGEMHRAYSGNAKAMRILSSTINLDYGGNLEAFWQDHQANLLDEPDLEDLVSSHFNRLQQIYPEAYRLLCRMGCYRFQDVATVPIEGLFCLLWDVPKPQHRSIVRFLRDLFLLEVVEEEYRLHPVIQAKAVAMLRADPQEWERANQKAADFWTTQVTTIETVEEALMAAEAYRHYIQIEDWEAAAAVLLYGRDSQWEKEEPLGISFYRLGLLQRMIAAISRIIDRLQPGYPPCKLHNILGDLYWLTGNLDAAIACHQKSKELAIEFQLNDLEIQALFNIGLCHIGFWQLSEAIQFFESASTLAENTEWHRYAVGSWFCLAYLGSCLGQQQQARTLTQKVFDQYDQISSTAWSRGYSLLFLAATLRNLGELEKAEQIYELAQDYAEQSRYPQVKAEVLNGLAILARERQDFQGAIANHLAAKHLLDRIEAKGDLAEVNYQLGLTYQAMSEFGESRKSLQVALHLFEQMNAPKQVERVRQQLQAME